MIDSKKVIKGMECCLSKDEHPCRDCPYAMTEIKTTRYCRADNQRDALALIKEQKAILNKAYEVLADSGFDIFCDDLVCDDGWCDEHCTTSGVKPECVERWLKKQITEGVQS